MTALLEVHGLVKTFGSGETATPVLKGLNLALQPGDMAALLGAGFGYGVLSFFPAVEDAKPGSLPIDVRQGAYGMAILLTTIGAIFASILPARGAARLDPVRAIGQGPRCWKCAI